VPDDEHVDSTPVARLDLRLSDEEKAAAQAEADRQGVSLSGVVRQAVAFYLGWLAGQREPPEGR
jgi:hypothetical protein